MSNLIFWKGGGIACIFVFVIFFLVLKWFFQFLLTILNHTGFNKICLFMLQFFVDEVHIDLYSPLELKILFHLFMFNHYNKKIECSSVALIYDKQYISDHQWNKLSASNSGSVWTFTSDWSWKLCQGPNGGTKTHKTCLRNESHQEGAC